MAVYFINDPTSAQEVCISRDHYAMNESEENMGRASWEESIMGRHSWALYLKSHLSKLYIESGYDIN